jgi:hypothetical protein
MSATWPTGRAYACVAERRAGIRSRAQMLETVRALNQRWDGRDGARHPAENLPRTVGARHNKPLFAPSCVRRRRITIQRDFLQNTWRTSRATTRR